MSDAGKKLDLNRILRIEQRQRQIVVSLLRGTSRVREGRFGESVSRFLITRMQTARLFKSEDRSDETLIVFAALGFS